MIAKETRDCFTYNWAKSLHLNDETVTLLLSNGFQTKAQLLSLKEVIETIQFPNPADKAAISNALKKLTADTTVAVEVDNNRVNGRNTANGKVIVLAKGTMNKNDREANTEDQQHETKKSDENTTVNENNERSIKKDYSQRKFIRNVYFTLSLCFAVTVAIMIYFHQKFIKDRWFSTFLYALLSSIANCVFFVGGRKITDDFKIPDFLTGNSKRMFSLLAVLVIINSLFLSGFAAVNREPLIYSMTILAVITCALTVFALQNKLSYRSEYALLISLLSIVVIGFAIRYFQKSLFERFRYWKYSYEGCVVYILWVIFGVNQAIKGKKIIGIPMSSNDYIATAIIMFIGYSFIIIFNFVFYATFQ